jgi:hypothetical protein
MHDGPKLFDHARTCSRHGWTLLWTVVSSAEVVRGH